MLSKAHLTSHSRMSGSRSVITPLWLSGSWRSFLYSSSMHSCYLFLISSASIRSLTFLSFIVPIFGWSIPMVSPIFLKRSIFFTIYCFPLILALFTYEDFLISPCYSLEICISLSISFPFLFAVQFSYILSCFEGLPRQPLCLLTVVFLGDGFGHPFPYNVTLLP